VEYDRLCEQLITHYRNLMVAKSSKRPEELIVCLPEVLEQYREQARRFPVAEILESLTILQETLSTMTRTTYRRIELEMAAVKLCQLRSPAVSAPVAAAPGLEDRLARLEQQLHSGAPAAPAAAAAPAPAEAKPAPAPKAEPQPQPNTANQPLALLESWTQVLAFLSKTNVPLSGFLHGSRAFVQGNRVLIDCRNSMFLDLVRNNQKAKDDLKQAIAQATGKNYAIGPYRGEAAPAAGQEPKESDPVEALLQNARAAGIPIEMK